MKQCDGSTKELGKQPKTFKDFLKVFISDDGDKKSMNNMQMH